MIKDYKDLIVWKKAVDLCVLIYNLTKDFPNSEQFGITSQMRRCSVSIPSNIAEGCGRKLQSKDQKHFLFIAYGSAQELETQLIISHKLDFLTKEQMDKTLALLQEIQKILYVFIFKATE